jgi:hypothetical protein
VADDAAGRWLLAATYLVLVAIGLVLGVIETFLVPQRLFGGVEGLSAALALLVNTSVGVFGGLGTRTLAGAVAPFAGWFVAVAALTVAAPGGDVVLAGKLPADPGVVMAGTAYLFVGVFAAALTFFVTVRYGRPRATPNV